MIDREALDAILAGAEALELLAVAGELQVRAFALVMDQKTQSQDEDRLPDMSEVAKVLGVPEGQARELGRRGELPVVQVGRYAGARVVIIGVDSDT